MLLLMFFSLIAILITCIFIAGQVFKGLQKNGKVYAWVWSILVFLISFAILGYSAIAVIVYNAGTE
jgi:hypothetical protein